MKIYILIETADIEILGVHVCSDVAVANAKFDAIAQELSLPEHELTLLTHELVDTLRLAGDDSAAVQLIERELT